MIEAPVDLKLWSALPKFFYSQPMVLAAWLDLQTWTVAERESEAPGLAVSCFVERVLAL